MAVVGHRGRLSSRTSAVHLWTDWGPPIPCRHHTTALSASIRIDSVVVSVRSSSEVNA